MATLIPSSTAGREMSPAEQRVLERLGELDDAWRIYHGLRYVAPPGGGKPAVEGEIDVLVLHPDHGMLVLEVKGGGIQYDGRTRQFTSEDRTRRPNVIKSPFEQASRNLHELKKLMASSPGWSETGVDFVHGHGVVFPDCRWAPPAAAPDMPAEIVIDSDGMTAGELAPRLVALFAFWGRGRTGLVPIGRQRLKRLAQRVLAPHFALMPALGDVMAWDERALVRLSDEQELALDFLERNPRALVEGCSGSGKTLIALERVRRLASEGKSVLFLCFNRILGQTLREAVKVIEGLPGRVTATTFHGLCREMWERMGREWSDEPDRTARSPEAGTFWREGAMLRLLEAVTVLPERFDALVVDEAQDFETGWWTPLFGLLASQEAPVSLFLDPDQDLWDRKTDVGEKLPVFPIRSNRRSTRAIAEFAARIAGVKVRNPWGVPDGEWPEVSRWKLEEEQLDLVEGKLRWLLEDQKVALSRLAVVGMHAWEKCFLCRAESVWGIPVMAVDDEGRVPAEGALRYATPHRFKGLEADIVLLVDVDGDPQRCRPRNLYVAASRARHRLCVFAKEGVALPEPPREQRQAASVTI